MHPRGIYAKYQKLSASEILVYSLVRLVVVLGHNDLTDELLPELHQGVLGPSDNLIHDGVNRILRKDGELTF